jgi:iron complex transport system ATP-binding protein
MEAARAEAEAGAGVLVVLHDLNLAAAFADRILLLDAGRTAAAGTPAEVFESARLTAVYRTPITVEHTPAGPRMTPERRPPAR